MAARLEKVDNHPGVYRRVARYVFSYRMNGKQRWESARTLTEAEGLKRRRQVAAERGDSRSAPFELSLLV